MKTIKPVDVYRDDGGYPSLDEVLPDRRQFLQAGLGGAAALAAGLLPGGEGRAAGRRRPALQKIRFWFLGRYRFPKCRYAADKIIVQTRDKRLVSFVKDARERKGLDGAIKAVLKKHGCADVTDRKKLTRLERRLAQAVARRYRSRTRRRTGQPIVTLMLVRPHHGPIKGDIARPAPPVDPSCASV